MKKIGITGNIASGKSEIEKILIKLGFKVVCADEIVGELYKDNEVKKLITGYFNTLNKDEIARIIFSNSNESHKLKKALEGILHPRVIKKIEEFFVSAARGGANFAFASVPLIYEAGLEKLFDKVIFVSADDKIREKRLMVRDNTTKELARLKMASQMPQEEKIKLADFVIENDSTLKNLENQTILTLEKLCLK